MVTLKRVFFYLSLKGVICGWSYSAYFGSIFIENNEANQALDDTEGRAEKTGGTFGKLGGAATALGGVMAGVLAAGIGAAVAGLGALVVAGDNMQKALNGLQTQTGATDEEMKGMSDSLKEIYRNNYGESFQDIADSMSSVRQATGATGEELEKMTKTALMMRDTFGYEVNESINAVDKMMKNFGITSDEAFTLLAQGQQKGLNASGDLIDTFTEYSPVFKQLGFDAEGMFNILADGAANGVRNTDVLADAVKEFGIRVKDGSKLTAESFAGLGLNADEMANKFAQGGQQAQEAFEQTMAALGQIEDPIARNTIGVGLFGTKFEDLEHQAVLSLGNVESVANQSADTLAQIDSIKYNTIGEALQGIGRNILMGVVQPMGDKALPVINKFGEWIDSKMPVIESVTKKTFETIGMVTDTVFMFFRDNILPILDQLYSNVETMFPAIQIYAETVFNAWVEYAKTAWDFFKVNLLPILLSLYNMVQENMPTIRKNVEDAFNAVVRVGQKVWTFFKENILPILASLYGYIQEKMPQIRNIVEGVFNTIISVVEIAWDLFENILLPALWLLWKFIEPTFPLIGKIVEETFNAIIAVVEATVIIFDKVSSAIEKAVDWLTFWDNKEPKKKTLEVEEVSTNSISGSSIPQYATGTKFHPGGYAIVGERGPELLHLPRGSKVSTANETRDKLSGNSIIQNININSPTPLSPSEIARQNLKVSRQLAMELM